jgi:hypothetical protein
VIACLDDEVVPDFYVNLSCCLVGRFSAL